MTPTNHGSALPSSGAPAPAPTKEIMTVATLDKTCPCGKPLIRDGVVVKAHWQGTVCEDCEAMMFARHNAPKCWRCKERPGVVIEPGYETAPECVECAGEQRAATRRILNEISDAVRAGLTIWPKIADRVEFVRECVKLHREQAVRFGR